MNKKLTIDYQPNKSLIIEYGDYEEQKKYAFFYKFKRSFVWWIPLILYSIGMCFIKITTHNLPIVLLVITLLLSCLCLPFVVLFIANTFYYKLEITPQKVIEKDLKRTKEYLFSDKITMEVDGLEKDKLFGFSIDENFYFTFDMELEQSQKPVVLKAMIELFNLELTETKENKVDKMSWKSSIYQSKNNKI